MTALDSQRICGQCGEALASSDRSCPLCSGCWECRVLRFPPFALEDVQTGISDWVAALPLPSVLQLSFSNHGLRIRLYSRPGAGQAAVAAWAALTRQQSRWEKVGDGLPSPAWPHILHCSSVLPALSMSSGDPLLSLGASLSSTGREGNGGDGLFFWLLAHEEQLQARLQALSAYAKGTERGVDDDTPNPWSLRLRLWRVLIGAGGLCAALGAAAILPGWLPAAAGSLVALAGALILVAGFLGTQRWMAIRSIPPAALEERLGSVLLRSAVVFDSRDPQNLRLVAGPQRWAPIKGLWPHVRAHSFPLSASDIARIITPLSSGEGSGVLESVSTQDVPAAPPSSALIGAPERIGFAAATGEPVGVASSGHIIVPGGRRRCPGGAEQSRPLGIGFTQQRGRRAQGPRGFL